MIKEVYSWKNRFINVQNADVHPLSTITSRSRAAQWPSYSIQNKKFITVSCTNCGFTELYRSETSTGENVLDFLINA